MHNWALAEKAKRKKNPGYEDHQVLELSIKMILDDGSTKFRLLEFDKYEKFSLRKVETFLKKFVKYHEDKSGIPVNKTNTEKWYKSNAYIMNQDLIDKATEKLEEKES